MVSFVSGNPIKRITARVSNRQITDDGSENGQSSNSSQFQIQSLSFISMNGNQIAFYDACELTPDGSDMIAQDPQEAQEAETKTIQLGNNEELFGIYGVKDEADWFTSFGFITKTKQQNSLAEEQKSASASAGGASSERNNQSLVSPLQLAQRNSATAGETDGSPMKVGPPNQAVSKQQSQNFVNLRLVSQNSISDQEPNSAPINPNKIKQQSGETSR